MASLIPMDSSNFGVCSSLPTHAYPPGLPYSSADSLPPKSLATTAIIVHIQPDTHFVRPLSNDLLAIPDLPIAFKDSNHSRVTLPWPHLLMVLPALICIALFYIACLLVGSIAIQYYSTSCASTSSSHTPTTHNHRFKISIDFF